MLATYILVKVMFSFPSIDRNDKNIRYTEYITILIFKAFLFDL